MLTSVVLLALGGCTSAGVWLGCVAEELRGRERRYVEERDAVATAVERDPAFADVLIMVRTDRGGVWLTGTVPTAGDLERLRGIVVRGIGESRAEAAVKQVTVRR